MEIIYVSTVVSKKKINYIINNSKNKPLQSIQKFHRLLCEGFVKNGVKVKTLSSIPMSRKISNKTIWIDKKEKENGIEYTYIPFINIKILRQACTIIGTTFKILKEGCRNKEEKIFICDVLNTTIAFATLILSKILKFKCIAIVTDLPRDIGGKFSISKKVNQFLQDKYDAYIVLTEAMNEVVNPRNKPSIVIEGISDNKMKNKDNTIESKHKEKVCIYAGGLYEKYGVKNLVEAFKLLKQSDVRLYLYGAGDLEEYLKKIDDDRIQYFGVVENEIIVEEEINATLLINPRFSNEEYTKYSFPSKNMEYMASGTPVLTTKLPGMPKEYYDYIYCFEEESVKGMNNALEKILNIDRENLHKKGKEAKKFVLENKNNITQAKKIIDLCNNYRRRVMKKKLQDLASKINKNKLDIYLFIYIFAIIVLSRNTMISSYLIGFEKSVFISIIFSIPIMIIFIRKIIKKDISLKKTKIVLPFIIAIIISIIVKQDWQLYNISILYYICISVMLASILDFEKFKKYFINIMIFLAMYSLVTTYIVKPILIDADIEEKLINKNLIIYNSLNCPFLNLGFGFAYFSEIYMRNYGIFTEPSFYQFYLIIAIIFILFFNKKNTISDIIKVIILTITAFTTFSSAAIPILALTFLTQFIKLIIKNKENKKKIICIIVGVILLLIMLLQMNIVRNTINEIYFKITTKNDSSNSRFGSVMFTVENFLESPIVGKKISEIIPYENHLTNTTFAIGAIYGIIGLIYNLYFTYKLSKFDSIWLTIAIFCVILLAYNSHIYIGVHSFWLILLSRIDLGKDKVNEDTVDC